jgi:membrane fusion protein (multidrug efflux system)
MKQKVNLWKSLLLSILFLTVISCSKKSDLNLSADETSMEVVKLPVDVIEVRELELIQEENLVGTLLPIQEVAIVSEVAQKITRIAFKDGDFVSKGQLLYKLNDADLRAKQKELYAELELARINEKRYASLLQTEAIRQQEYDEIDSKLQSLQAQAEFLNFQISKTEIRAPFAGKIGITNVDLGAYVYPGLELVNLQDQSKFKINFSVPEKYALLARNGKSITFVTQLSTKEYKATITASNSGLNNQNRSLMVQAVTDNSQNEFRGGMSAKIKFSTIDIGVKGIKIPSQALIPGENGYNVYVLSNDRAKTTPVKIGARTESEVTILSGIKDGDKVIISNILRLGEGTAVAEVETTN